MTEAMSDEKVDEKAKDRLAVLWPKIAILFSAIGGSFAYIVSHWSAVEPVLSSPAMVLVSMLSIYGLGGLSAYWLVARPLEHRLNRAEGVIGRLRDRERELGEQIMSLRVDLAKLETQISMMGNR